MNFTFFRKKLLFPSRGQIYRPVATTSHDDHFFLQLAAINPVFTSFQMMKFNQWWMFLMHLTCMNKMQFTWFKSMVIWSQGNGFCVKKCPITFVPKYVRWLYNTFKGKLTWVTDFVLTQKPCNLSPYLPLITLNRCIDHCKILYLKDKNQNFGQVRSGLSKV